MFDLDPAHVLLQRLIERPAVGMPEHHARRLFLQVEEIHALGQLAVIPLLCLFKPLQIRLELLLVTPGGAVNAGQHWLAGITTPVGARQLGQLVRLEMPGVGHVWPPAHIGIFLVVIKTDGLAGRNPADKLLLVRLVALLKRLHRLLGRDVLAYHVVFRFNQGLHAGFDSRQIIRGHRLAEVDIVVKAVIDDRTDSHFGLGVELLDGMPNQVRTGVTNNLETFGIACGDNRDFRITLNEIGGIHQFTVDLAGHTGFGQTGADGFGQLHHADGFVEGSLAAIRQGHDGHVRILCTVVIHTRDHVLRVKTCCE